MKLVLPVFVVAFVAFALGWFASSSFRRTEPVDRVVNVEPATTKPSAQLEDPARLAHETQSAQRDTESAAHTPERQSEGLISEALRKYALAELDAGWHETRKDPLPEALRTKGFEEFDKAVRALPREIGRRLAEEQTQTVQLASDDPFIVLEAIRQGRLGPQLAIVQDAKRFERFFACNGGRHIDGVALAVEPPDSASPIPDGATVDFPVGVHDIEPLARRLQQKAPSCLAIRGAGMDRTLIKMRTIQPPDRLDRFEIRDCTVLSECDAIDLHAAGVWRAERVRFIGFDCGAGGCGVFDVGRGAVLQLKSCRLEGGYGRNPGDGCLFDSRSSAMLVRMEDCTLDSLHLSASSWGRNMTVVIDRCRLVNMLDGAMPVDRDNDGLVLTATTMELRSADAGRLPKRELADLFPNWFQSTKR